MNTNSMLIVEDEENIAEFLQKILEPEGYATAWAPNGRTALAYIQQTPPTLILLDLTLPDMDGLQICRQVRQQSPYIPIIMVTAKDSDVDKVVGLEVGADDYITKPIKSRELLARVRAVLRLAQSRQADKPNLIQVGSLEIDLDGHMVTLAGKEIGLRPKEFDLLTLLASNPGKVFGREMLLERVWGYDYHGASRTVDVHIQRLRKKLKQDEANPFIITVPLVGYKFTRFAESA
jgi:two-component system alkaline phosphatase synthesis response regulator PhoP